MAKEQKESKEKSLTDRWRDAYRKALASQAIATTDADVRDTLASELAKAIENSGQKNATIECDGQMFAPKKSTVRETKDGSAPKVPRFSHQLVKYATKTNVEI